MVLPKFAKSSCSKPLPSKKLYNKWDAHLNSIKPYYEICRQGTNTYSNNDKIIKLCSMALLHLKNYDNSTERKSLTCNRCKLFNYWILDHLNETFKDKPNFAYSWLYFLVNTFPDNSEFIKKNKCELDFQISSDVKWKVKKEFYEYVINYFQINTRAKLDDDNCQKYQNYLQNNSLLNAYIEDILPDVEKNDLSKIYGKCQNVNQEVLLSKLQNNADGLIDDEAEEDEEDEGPQLLPQLTPILEAEESDDDIATGPMPFTVPQGKFDVSYYIKSINSSPYTIPSILSITGVSALAMFLHKFKSYRSLLRREREQTIHFADDFNKEFGKEFSDNSAKYATDNFEKDQINIAYQNA